jgi:hypothetical protein
MGMGQGLNYYSFHQFLPLMDILNLDEPAKSQNIGHNRRLRKNFAGKARKASGMRRTWRTPQ